MAQRQNKNYGECCCVKKKKTENSVCQQNIQNTQQSHQCDPRQQTAGGCQAREDVRENQPCRTKKEHKIQMIGCVDFYLMDNLKLIPNISSQKKAVSSNLTDDFELSICILGPLTKYSINTATFVCVSVCKLHDKNHLRQSPESHKARPSTKPTVRLAAKLTFLFKSRACFQTLRRSPACPAWFSH